MENIGSLLKKKRLDKGLSLETISKDTKIQLHLLEALEKNECIDLGGEGYNRIVLISFARSVGCTEAEIESMFKVGKEYRKHCSSNQGDELFPTKLMFNKNLLFGILLLIIMVILAVTVVNLYRNQKITFPFRGNSSPIAETESESDIIEDDFDFDFPAEQSEPYLNEQVNDDPIIGYQQVDPAVEEAEFIPEEEVFLAGETEQPSAYEKSIFDRNDYLKSLLSINTDSFLPLKDTTSYLRHFIITDR